MAAGRSALPDLPVATVRNSFEGERGFKAYQQELRQGQSRYRDQSSLFSAPPNVTISEDWPTEPPDSNENILRYYYTHEWRNDMGVYEDSVTSLSLRPPPFTPSHRTPNIRYTAVYPGERSNPPSYEAATRGDARPDNNRDDELSSERQPAKER